MQTTDDMDSIQRMLSASLSQQRAMLSLAPIHEQREPVSLFAAQIAFQTGEAYCVMSIPQGLVSYQVGYRYASIPAVEFARYRAHGAELVEQPAAVENGEGAEGVPGFHGRQASAYDFAGLYAKLCDAWLEANAVQSPNGRPGALLQKLAEMRDEVGAEITRQRPFN